MSLKQAHDRQLRCIQHVKRVIKRVRNFEWGHADGCKFLTCPLNECPIKECDPLYHIERILEDV